jgi:uncharacterized phiE125 gp8 family phage protein
VNLEVITAPAVEPVTDAQAFFHLKLTTDPEADVSDEPQLAEVQRCVRTAREQCEQITRRAFVQQTIRLSFTPGRNEWRGLRWYMNGGSDNWGRVELRRPPLISVSSVKYYDDDNVLQTVAAENYFVVTGLVPRLQFTAAFAFPTLYVRADAVRIEYIAGYPVPEGEAPDLAANVPASIKDAILIGAQMLFDKLTPAEHESAARARDSLLSSYRVVSL